MEQEAVLANLLKSNFSSDISQSNLTFIGQLPNQEQVYFQAHAIAEDNDCGFHALGLDRSKAVTQLLAHAKDENIRHLVAPEIKAAFLEGTLPKEMQDEEYQSLRQKYTQAWESYRQILAEVKEHILALNVPDAVNIQSLTPDELITWLDFHNEYGTLKEQLIKARLNIVFPVERQLEVYSEKEAVFVAFIQHYLGKGGWLTYIGNYQNKTQQGSSLDALVELNRIQVFIWQVDSSNSQQLQLVHHYGKSEHASIHMLHTHEMTHYDLLQPVEKPALAMTFSSTIPFGKQEEDLLDSSLMISSDNNNHLIISSDEKQSSIQLSPEVKKIIEEIKQAQAQEKVDYALQAEAFIKLGNYYLEQKEYLYAAAIYNYVLNVYHLKLFKQEQNEKLEQAATKNEAEQKVFEKLINLEEQFIIALKAPLQKKSLDNLHDYLKSNSEHRDRLQKLREDCKQRLADIDNQYPFDIYDEEKAKGQEEKFHRLQLEKAEAIHVLYHEIAERLKDFIRQLIQECIKALGDPPCDYAVIGLGSLSREEATPYSDLEFAILIVEEKEEYKEYFRKLTNLIHLKVINLGETILPSMAIPVLNNYYSNDPLKNWFYDDVTPRGFAFDGAMPQACKTPLGKKDQVGKVIYELIHTPEEMVKFLGKKENDLDSKYWFNYEPHLSMILITNTLIGGSKNLFQVYQNSVWQALQQIDIQAQVPLHEAWALRLLKGDDFLEYLAGTNIINKNKNLKGDIQEFDFDLRSENEEGKLYDVKKEIYRFFDRVLERLAIYFGIKTNTVWNRITIMNELKFINAKAAFHLKIATSITVELRLRVYIANNGQQENLAIYSDMSDKNIIKTTRVKEIFKLPSFNQLFYFYFTALPLYQAVIIFCQMDLTFFVKKDNLKFFSEIDFFDNSHSNRAQICKRLLLYQEAKFYLEKSLNNHQQNQKILCDLGLVNYKLGYFQDSIKYHQQILNMIQDQAQIISSLDIAATYNNLGAAYRALDEIENAKDCYQKALVIMEEQYQRPHSDIADILSNLGNIYLSLHEFEKSVDYHQKAMSIRKQLYPATHIRIVISLVNLGNVYSILNKIPEAIDYYQRALKLEMKLYSFQPNINTSIILNNIGENYYALGQFNIAIEYYQGAWMIHKYLYKTILYPQTVSLLNNLGKSYSALSNYHRAIEIYQEALTIQKRFSLKLDSDLADLLTNLANVYRKLGQFQQALFYSQEALQIYTQLRNPSYLNMATCLNILGHIYFAEEKLDEAFKVYQQSLDICVRFYPTQMHPHFSDAWNNIANVHSALGQFEKAIEFYQKSLELGEKLYQNRHPNIAASLNNLGNAHYDLGNFNKANEYHSLALKMRVELYPEQIHPDIAVSWSNLGNTYYALGKFEDAAKVYQQALEMQKQLYKEPHPEIAALLNNLGNVYDDLGQYEKAIEYCLLALNMQNQTYSTPHSEIACSLNNLGNAYFSLDSFEEAINYHQQALAMRRELYPEQIHPDVADSLNNLGNSYRALGKLQAALSFHQQALTMRQQIYLDKNHPNIAASLNNLALTYEILDNLEQAQKLFGKSYAMYTYLLGPAHLTTKKVKSNYVRSSLRLGNYFIFEGKFKEAKFYYSVINGNPQDTKLQQALLWSYYLDNKLSLAIEHARILIHLTPLDSSNYHNLACFCHIEAQLAKEKENEADYQVKLKQTEASFEKALSLVEAKPYSSIYAEFGNFLYQNGHHKEALIYLLKATALKADNRGLSYGEMEKPTVTDELKKEIDFRGEIQLKAFVLAYRLLVSTYKKLGQITEAEKVIEEFTQAAANEKEDLTFMLLGHAYSELKQFELAKTAYQNAIQYYKPIAEHPTYMLAENYLRDCQQKLNEVKQEISSKKEIDLTKENDEELSEVMALSLNIPQKEEISTNYSSATLLTQHSAIYGSDHQVSPTTSQSTASSEEQTHSSVAEEEDLELEEAFRLSLENK